MSEHFDENENARESGLGFSGVNRWLVVAVVAMIAVAGIALGYGYRQRSSMR